MSCGRTDPAQELWDSLAWRYRSQLQSGDAAASGGCTDAAMRLRHILQVRDIPRCHWISLEFTTACATKTFEHFLCYMPLYPIVREGFVWTACGASPEHGNSSRLTMVALVVALLGPPTKRP